jgi:CRP-like cAMP-binding protein
MFGLARRDSDKELLTEKVEECKREAQRYNEMLAETDELIVVERFGPGDSIGEEAVVDFKPRKFTCSSTKECLFMVVPRLAYCKVFDRLIATRNRDMFQFLRQVPFMTSWFSRELLKFSQNMELMSF